jgi:hypothetical protein
LPKPIGKEQILFSPCLFWKFGAQNIKQNFELLLAMCTIIYDLSCIIQHVHCMCTITSEGKKSTVCFTIFASLLDIPVDGNLYRIHAWQIWNMWLDGQSFSEPFSSSELLLLSWIMYIAHIYLSLCMLSCSS